MLLRALVVVAFVAVVALVGAWWSRRRARVRAGSGRLGADRLEALGLDAAAGGPMGLLLGAATCTPCVPVRRLLREVAGEHPGFRWAAVDVADELALAEEFGVRSVPTLLVLDASGEVVARSVGVPARGEIDAAIVAAAGRS